MAVEWDHHEARRQEGPVGFGGARSGRRRGGGVQPARAGSPAPAQRRGLEFEPAGGDLGSQPVRGGTLEFGLPIRPRHTVGPDLRPTVCGPNRRPSSTARCRRTCRTASVLRCPCPTICRPACTMLSDAPLMTTHEWYAHGTCAGVTPPEYFPLATDLAGEVSGPQPRVRRLLG